MTRILPMVCGSLIVNNKIIEISKLIEECGLSRPLCRRPTFACYLHLVAATGLYRPYSAVPTPLHWTFWGDLVQWRRQLGPQRVKDYRAKAGFWVTQPNL